jgi:virulence factor Mce-like protein
MIRKLGLITGGTIFLAAITAAVYFSVSWAYGAYGDYYYLTAELDRAGQQVKLGGDVRIRGVIVGKISGIDLVDRRARLTLEIERQHRVPASTEAVISLKTPLGAKFVNLQFNPRDNGRMLEDGDRIAKAHTGPELEDALEDGVSVLEAINPDDAATIIFELSEASRGRGDMIARGIRANSRLSNLFAATLDPQIRALDDFVTIFGALEEVGVDLNLLAEALNEGAPVYASPEAQAALRRALETVTPFANDFADLLILNRADWDRMIESGDVVLSTVAARPQGLRNMVHGLYRYMRKLGGDIPVFFRMEDGSIGAGFTAFIGGNDQGEEEAQLCDAFPPDVRKEVPFCKRGPR